MEENKPVTSWVYNLNKEELMCQLNERDLPTNGNFAILRERLVKAIKCRKEAIDPFKPSHTPSCGETSQTEDTPSNHSGSINSLHDENPIDSLLQQRIERFNTASQTYPPFPNSEAITDPGTEKELENNAPRLIEVVLELKINIMMTRRTTPI